jgi:hypothetical protein
VPAPINPIRIKVSDLKIRSQDRKTAEIKQYFFSQRRYKKFIFVDVSNDSTKNHLDSLISSQNLGNPIYPAKLFQARLKEEFLRTNRIQRPFLYIKIFARQFDIFGWAKPDDVILRTWSICVLSMLSQTKFTDVVGYLSEGSGLGLILLDSDVSTLEQIRKQMLRNLHDANLLSQLRENKPKAPVFKAYVYTGLLEKKTKNWIPPLKNSTKAAKGL